MQHLPLAPFLSPQLRKEIALTERPPRLEDDDGPGHLSVEDDRRHGAWPYVPQPKSHP